MNKGQLFLISGVVVVIVLVLLKTSLNFVKIIENRRYLESELKALELGNVEDEIFKTIQISYTQKQNISANVNNFTKFARSILRERAVDLNGFFVESIYSNSTRLNTTVFNFLGNQISLLNLTLNGSEPQLFYSVDDGGVVETNFTFAGEGNYSLKVFYNTSYGNDTKEIVIPYEEGGGKFVGFFDLRFIGIREEFRDEFTETVALE